MPALVLPHAVSVRGTPAPEIYTLSLHDALPISSNFTTLRDLGLDRGPSPFDIRHVVQAFGTYDLPFRSEEHTSELQSPMYLVCRLLLEKKKYPRAGASFSVPCCCSSRSRP